MYLEKNNSPGQLINLEYVASMDWDIGLTAKFIMANGSMIPWTYDSEEDKGEDQAKVTDMLYKAGNLISVELDQE